MSSLPLLQGSNDFDHNVVPARQGLSGVALIFACGAALFSDGYANNVIGSVNTLLNRVYGKEIVSAHNYSKTLSSLVFIGTIIGMLTFGYLCDRMGRKFGMMLATGIVAVFSALSAISFEVHDSVGSLLAMLSACRFFLGVGIGAEYSCGSVAASEQSEEPGISRSPQHRWFVLATNTASDLGFVTAALVPLLLFWMFGDNHLEVIWRMSLGFGTLPAMAVLFWRLKMEEPLRFKKDSMAHTGIPYILILRRYWVNLTAISIVWFIYDFIEYPFSIYSSTILNNITGGSTSLSTVFGAFYLPGTITGAFVVDILGPKNTMIAGLILQAMVGFIMSGFYVQLTNHIATFSIVYGIFLSMSEFGPGNCVGLFAAKSGPTAVRGQFYGIAAAIGKAGAFAGTWAFPPIIEVFGGAGSIRGNTGPFWVASGLAMLSAMITFFFIHPLSHDGMEEEDAKFRTYLEQEGYDTSHMGTEMRTLNEQTDQGNSGKFLTYVVQFLDVSFV